MSLQKFLPLLVIVALGLLIYAKSFNNAFVLDDSSQLNENPQVKSLSNIPKFFLGSTFGGGRGGLQGVYYKPLMTASYALLYHFFGASPIPYHVLQTSLHIVNAILVFILLGKFLDKRLAFGLTLIFLVHTLNSESVVYVSALQDPLFFFFGMSALLVAIKEKLKLVDFFFFGILIFLAFLSKETAVLFWVSTIAFRLIFSRKNKRELFSFLAVSLVILSSYIILRQIAVGLPVSGDRVYPIMRLSFWWRIANIPAEIFYYLRNFFFPRDLAVGEHWIIKNISLRTFYLPLFVDVAFFGLILAFGYWIFKKKSENFKIYLFFLIWIVLGFGIHLNILPLDVTVADRWFYFPVVGLLGLIGVAISRLTVHSSQFTVKVLTILAFLILLTLSIRTYVRLGDWKDGLTLAGHDIVYSRDSFPLENNLGFELIKAGLWDEAEVHVKRSTELAPYWWLNWNNLGVVYRHKAMTDSSYLAKAIDSFKHGIENTTVFYMPYENLADLLVGYGTPQEAEQFIMEAAQRIPLSSRMVFLLAIAEYQMDKRDVASQLAYKAYQLDSTNVTSLQFYNALVGGSSIKIERNVY